MKRHPSLRELSVDHHHGLVHARRLLQASLVGAAGTTQAPAQDVARDFLRFFAADGNNHFREEEEVLLPAFARYGDPAEPAIVRMLLEHIQIRRLVSDLGGQLAAGDPDSETLRAAGVLLQAHIRLEEDVVFPLIERSMPEDALSELARLLAAQQPAQPAQPPPALL